MTHFTSWACPSFWEGGRRRNANHRFWRPWRSDGALAEPERIAATLRALSFVALEQGAFERARALWAELVALELGDPKWTYMENELLGEIELAAGNLDEALEYNERALAEARDLDLIRMVPDLLHVVGDVHLLRRSLDEAEGHSSRRSCPGLAIRV